MADRETLNVYAARAKEYADRFSSKTPSLYLAAFMLAVKKKGRVLDLGCGTGQATAFMLAEGLEVDSTDASPEMASVAKEKFDIDVQIETSWIPFSIGSEHDLWDLGIGNLPIRGRAHVKIR